MPRRVRITAQTVRGPRRFLRFPEEFGVTDPPDIVELDRSHRFQGDSALVQHEVARMVLEQMTRLNITHDELAGHLDISAEQLRRLLRGESATSVERLFHLASLTGLHVQFRLTRSE